MGKKSAAGAASATSSTTMVPYNPATANLTRFLAARKANPTKSTAEIAAELDLTIIDPEELAKQVGDSPAAVTILGNNDGGIGDSKPAAAATDLSDGGDGASVRSDAATIDTTTAFTGDAPALVGVGAIAGAGAGAPAMAMIPADRPVRVAAEDERSPGCLTCIRLAAGAFALVSLSSTWPIYVFTVDSVGSFMLDKPGLNYTEAVHLSDSYDGRFPIKPFPLGAAIGGLGIFATGTFVLYNNAKFFSNLFKLSGQQLLNRFGLLLGAGLASGVFNGGNTRISVAQFFETDNKALLDTAFALGLIFPAIGNTQAIIDIKPRIDRDWRNITRATKYVGQRCGALFCPAPAIADADMGVGLLGDAVPTTREACLAKLREMLDDMEDYLVINTSDPELTEHNEFFAEKNDAGEYVHGIEDCLKHIAQAMHANPVSTCKKTTASLMHGVIVPFFCAMGNYNVFTDGSEFMLELLNSTDPASEIFSWFVAIDGGVVNTVIFFVLFQLIIDSLMRFSASTSKGSDALFLLGLLPALGPAIMNWIITQTNPDVPHDIRGLVGLASIIGGLGIATYGLRGNISGLITGQTEVDHCKELLAEIWEDAQAGDKDLEYLQNLLRAVQHTLDTGELIAPAAAVATIGTP